MAFENFYQSTKEINGVKYTAQFNGLSFRDETIDSSYVSGTDNVSLEKLSRKLFDNVLVEPKMSINDFGADKIGTTEEKIICGKKYVAKFNGILAALKAIDSSYIDGTSNTSLVKLRKFLFENVIVEPENLKTDDFETAEELDEVTAFAREVMQGGTAMTEFNEVLAFLREVMEGKFRPEENTSGAKKASRK